MVTQAQKLVKAEALMQTLQLGTVNREEVTYRILEAQEQANIPALMNIPPPQPDFETQLKMQEFQWKQQYEQEKLRLEEQRVTSEAVKDESQGIYQRVKAESQMRQDNLAELKLELEMVRDSVKQITEAQMERNNATKKVKRNAEGKLEIQQGEG